ncbi:MAG TPA: carboxymuconolactone decarboxylase family protein [Agromyces sp.]
MDHIELLRRLANADDRLSSAAFAEESTDPLGAKTHAIACLAALVGIGGTDASYAVATDAAVRAGVSTEELVHVITCTLPVVGVPRAVAAAQHLSVALGLELETFVSGDT